MRACRQSWCDVPALKLSFAPSLGFSLCVCVCICVYLSLLKSQLTSVSLSPTWDEGARYDSSSIKVMDGGKRDFTAAQQNKRLTLNICISFLGFDASELTWIWNKFLSPKPPKGGLWYGSFLVYSVALHPSPLTDWLATDLTLPCGNFKPGAEGQSSQCLFIHFNEKVRLSERHRNRHFFTITGQQVMICVSMGLFGHMGCGVPQGQGEQVSVCQDRTGQDSAVLSYSPLKIQ